jgi:ethanolamine utilization microcompartment shell protein EutS
MRTIDKIIESKEAPKDKNVLWVNGDKLLTMVKGKWTPIGGGSSDNVQGGASGGGKRLLFYDIKDLDVPTKRIYMGWAAIINGELTTGAKVIEIGAAFCMRFSDSHNYAHKVCIDLDGPLWLDGNHETVEENIKRTVGSLETLDQYATKITEEQFYTI